MREIFRLDAPGDSVRAACVSLRCQASWGDSLHNQVLPTRVVQKVPGEMEVKAKAFFFFCLVPIF